MNDSLFNVFDIECIDWDRFAAGVALCSCHGPSTHRTIESLVTRMLDHGGVWYSHYGGSYDMIAVVEELHRRNIRATIDMAQHRISRVSCSGLTLRDSWAMAPMSLDEFCEFGDLLTSDIGSCSCGVECGGYCGIRSMPFERVAEYALSDCEVLQSSLYGFSRFLSENGIEQAGTVGGIALKSAISLCELPESHGDLSLWRTMRESYFGGRVCTIRPVSANVSHYDINSAYPYAMTEPLPCGEPLLRGRYESPRLMSSGVDGIYWARVLVPDMLIPPLPVRHGGRIYYPTGLLDGAWTLPELRSAEDSGCTIERVTRSVTFRSKISLSPLIERIWAIRAKHGKESAIGKWCRVAMNSLAGKLAESPSKESVVMFPDDVQLCSCRRKNCTCGAYREIDPSGAFWARPFTRPSRYAHVQAAAYVTARIRAEWQKQASELGSSVSYGDTDSLWSSRAPSNVGDNLGQWSLKGGPYGSMIVHRSKSYEYDGNVVSSGLRTGNGVVPLVESVASGRKIFRRRVSGRTLPSRNKNGVYGDRVIDATLTRPLTMNEIKK